MSAPCECVCVRINTPNESLHSNFSILQDEKWRKWPLIQVQQMFTELITDHTDFLSRGRGPGRGEAVIHPPPPSPVGLGAAERRKCS